MSRSTVQYDPELLTLSRGLAGCHGETARSSVSIPDSRLSCYLGDVAPGGYVIDNRAVLDKHPGLAILAPMCSGRIAPDEVDRLADRVEPDNWLLGLFAGEDGHPFQGTAKLAQAQLSADGKAPGPMDFVGPKVHALWWLRHGARVGQRENGTIRWSDGTVETIRPPAERFQLANGEHITD